MNLSCRSHALAALVLAGLLAAAGALAMNPPPPPSAPPPQPIAPAPAAAPATTAAPVVEVPAAAVAPITSGPPRHLAAAMNVELRALAAGGGDLWWIGRQMALGQLEYRPDFWLRHVTHIFSSYVACYDPASRSYQNFAQVHPVTARFCITAHHTHNPSNRLCLLPDGTVYTNYFVASTNDGDIEVDLMARPNPSWYRVMPDYHAYCSGTDTNTFLCIRQHATMNGPEGCSSTFVSFARCDDLAVWEFVTGSGFHIASFPYGDYARGDVWVMGDSSSAAWAIIDNEAVLMGCAFTPNGCPYLDVTHLNAMIAGLAARNGVPAETVEAYPLDRWPKISP